MNLESYARAMKAPLWVAQALSERGIEDLDSARTFFRPSSEWIHHPSMLEGLEEIVAALIGIRDRGELLAIHGDYDVDGLTGAALLSLGLKECGFHRLEVYIPNRFDGGYGMTRTTVERFHSEGIRNILTVDTGISAVEEIELARSLGMKVYVTDHHKQGPVLPPAEAIANPNLDGSSYPNPHLSGVGVAFKLLELMVERLGLRVDLKGYLDFFALGTLADVVEVTGENRYYLVQGMKQLIRTRRPGIRALFRSLGVTGEFLRSQELLFRVTPPINAAGRMGDPRTAYDLLVTENPQEAKRLVDRLRSINEERRRVEGDAAQKAIEWLNAHPERQNDPVLLIEGSDWPEEVSGVIGIVAARLVDRFGKPIAIACIDPKSGLLCGSARGMKGFDWHAALASAEPLLTRWGGHCQAAGFSLSPEQVDRFREALIRYAESDRREPCKCGGEEGKRYSLGFDQIDHETIRWLQRFEPFGPGNELPVFEADDVELGGECRVVGQTHLKLKLKQNGHTFDAIAFGRGELCDCLQEQRGRLRIAFQPEVNRFRDRENLQLLIKEITTHRKDEEEV